MNFGTITEELHIEAAKKIVDSILNASFSASMVIDKKSFEIIYQNQKAVEILGDQIGMLCHEVLCTSEIPCIDCPAAVIKDGEKFVIPRYDQVLDADGMWQYSSIEWFDGRDVILVTMLASGENQDIIARSLTEQMAITAETLKPAEEDSLTHIPNRLKFYTKAQEAIGHEDKNYAIVVFDIERFKGINDMYGMTKGDDALKHIANVLREIYGTEENYGRMHSDMFALYMSYDKKGEIIRQIEKIRKMISSNDLNFDINTAFGIYLVADRGVPVNLMCDRAMMAERTIKGNIMKFCAFYDEQYRDEMLRAGEIERDMEEALEMGQYLMYLQPKYCLKDSSLCGAEVLCRWLHPKKGLVPPDEFIPLFEKNGFILKLDEYMWEQACRNIRRWLDEGRKPIPISVNISRYHFMHSDLEHVLMKLIRKYDLTPSMLNLEITESLFLDKPEELNRVLVRLQGLGFRLEVDDFGSGFSTLNLIRNISVDTIKIDREFLDSEIASEKGKIVVSHTIGMAKDLDLEVVAEGVETIEHVKFLKQSHCDIAQGFFFARPMPVDEFEKLAF